MSEQVNTNAEELEPLLVRHEAPLGWLILNRPQVRNALNLRTWQLIVKGVAELDADPDVRVIVNTGNGDAYQTGLDVRKLASDKAALREQSRRTRDFELRMTAWHCGVWKPVVAAVNGVCAGAGLHFVADADIVIASSTSSFLDPHVSVGQVSAIETIGLARKSPMEAVTRMAFMGRHERITADRARELGILSEVVEPPSLLRERAQEIGETIARNSPAAMAATKKALWEALEMVFSDR
jgi:enoyl-CoA hydratase/carnithine racemase